MDEYLWNKAGSDPEIERIEAALQRLAYRPTAPPEIPAKQFAFAAPRRSRFGLKLSFAAVFIALAAAGSVFFLLRTEPTTTQQAGVKTVFQTPIAPIQPESTAPVFADSSKASTTSKPQRRVAAPRRVPSKAIRPQTLVLTKEEADAYRQLMTALTITSTNLKIVKDSIGGTE